MLADGSHDYPRPLLRRLLRQDAGHDTRVSVVEMAHRLVEQDEVERLAERPHEGHPLLLPERHPPRLLVPLVGDAQLLEPLLHPLPAAEAGQPVLELHILPGRQLVEEAQFLKEHAQRTFPQVHPPGHGKFPDVLPVEGDDSLIVAPIPVDIAAQRRFSRARSRLDQIFLPFLENRLPVPHVGHDSVASGKHLGQCLL